MQSDSNFFTLNCVNSQLKLDLAAGAEVTSLSFGSNGKSIELIKTGAEIVHSNPWLFPFPNRLANGEYTFEGKSYQFPHNDKGRPNALHGFVRERAFKIIGQGSNDSEAWIEVGYHYAGDYAPYPFPFSIALKYVLKQGALEIAVKVNNTGSGNMPVGIGWHPYFHLSAGINHTSMKLPPCQEIEVNELMIPTGKKSPSTCFDSYRNLQDIELDTCFELNSKKGTNTTFLKSGEDYEIKVWQDAAHGFIQVFIPEDREFIAIEPMTCGIDAFNTGEGLKILAPGELWEVSCGVKLVQ